jgi:hypothetical protein
MDEKTPESTVQQPGCIFCALVPMMEKCWPENTREHFRNSRLEFLKGIRSLLDQRIATLSREESKGTRVTVE